MLEVAVIALRWLQYSGAVVLLGAPLFLLYSFRDSNGPSLVWARPTLIVAASVVVLGSLAALVAQTAVMAGSLSEGLKLASLSFMVTGMALGMAMVARAVVAAFALLAIIVLKPGRALWTVLSTVGVVASASFAWTGHAAGTEGPGALLHLTAAVIHAVSAALWLGALMALTILLLRRTATDDPEIHHALRGFSGWGTLAVALLVLSGLGNSWFMIGPERVTGLGTSLYGQLLIAKLALFALMLAIAATNRFRLTPALGVVLGRGENPRQALRRLRLNIIAETGVGAVLLAVVAVLGTLAPPSSM
ncbi:MULTISPECIES: copper homeostasis membrane protein CopD [unclassified Brevundimonas]|uniref:copper homeostasis membrane protein CopD n=1 Tax=unclassified Brevundimonas TaxID=2622653 RepID=UPI000700801F|nr:MULTISPECIES: copper homeostasis membrane protein CopD [unclassified Brevundimonas]KQY90139.1 copper resistance protein CopD [Brevundimonas sp. Root1423]KRA22924.1 copper resistance protein CopD [Brevundimonas sp. Root608]